MAKSGGKAFDYTLLKRLFVFVKPHKKLLWFTVISIIALSILAVLRPWLLSKAIDENVLASKNINQLIFWCCIVGCIIVAEAILQYYQTFSTGNLGLYVTTGLRKKLFAHIGLLRLRYFDKNPIGMLVTRVVSDIETVNDIFTEGLVLIFGDLLKLIAVLIMMFATNWQLSLFVLIPIPILLVATNIFKNVTRKSFQDVRNEVGRLNAFVQEHITGMALVQLFNRQESEYQKFKTINQKHRDAHIRSVMAYSIFFPVVDILAAASLGFLIWLGAHEALKQNVTIGELVAFILYISLLYRPIRQLADRFNTLQMGMVGCERIFAVLDTHEFVEQNNTIVPDENTHELVFDRLSFGYDTHGDPIPNEKGKFTKTNHVALNKITVSGIYRLVGVKNHQTAFLKYCEKNGLELLKQLKVINIEEFDGSITLLVDGSKVVVSHDTAAFLLVAADNQG